MNCAEVDLGKSPKGIKVSDKEVAAIHRACPLAMGLREAYNNQLQDIHGI
jgi:hypothetical protein